MKHLLAILIVVISVPLVASMAFAQMVSQYTKYTYEKCPETVELESESVTVRTCPGVAGYDVQWIEEIDASSVQFGKTRTMDALDIGDFFDVGTTIEWRGPSGPSPMQPLAAIVRYAVGQSIAGPRSSKLLIYRLQGGQSCLMAVVDGKAANANAKARDIADRAAESFQCGQSKRILE